MPYFGKLRNHRLSGPNPKTQIELDKASDLAGTGDSRVGINGFHNGMYEVFVSLLGLLVFGSMVGTLHILLLLLVAAGAAATGIVEKWADTRQFRLRMEEAPWQKKQDYFRNKLASKYRSKK